METIISNINVRIILPRIYEETRLRKRNFEMVDIYQYYNMNNVQ